jgi:redox-sensitive bicupin YhaK (pirin superfamily)
MVLFSEQSVRFCISSAICATVSDWLAKGATDVFAHKLETPARRIVYTTSGHTRGPITRLMSPSDLGQALKPFVFLDHAVFGAGEPRMPMELLWHPHSGIATVTVMLEGAVRFQETTGRDGVLPQGGVEYMQAGKGVWHTGEAAPGATKVFQLWVALPPELENAPFVSRYALPDEVPANGPVRVILGAYDGLTSGIPAPPMTYLQVGLEDGETWRYQPARGHDVAFVAVSEGRLHAAAPVHAGEIAVFERSEQAIDVVAEGSTRFVIGSAPQHAHELALGSYSVHTSGAALARGEAEIRRIGKKLRADGILRR